MKSQLASSPIIKTSYSLARKMNGGGWGGGGGVVVECTPLSEAYGEDFEEMNDDSF